MHGVSSFKAPKSERILLDESGHEDQITSCLQQGVPRTRSHRKTESITHLDRANKVSTFSAIIEEIMRCRK